jgi:EAL and modified HD-GYP domain-containing signal transduction protein
MRKWISLTAVACMGDEKPQELVMLPLIRARFCELMAPFAGLASSSNDLFLLGLLSAIDAILDMKMADILGEIAVRREIREALLGEQNAFRDIFEIVLLYEKGMWEEVYVAAKRVGIDVNELPELFLHAVDWARGLLAGHQTDETEVT